MIRMLRAVLLMGLATTPFFTATAYADQHKVWNNAAITDEGLPTRGMSMARVKKQWGNPGRTIAAVGKPPITRWLYDGYTVYFEYKLVITSVSDSEIGVSLAQNISQ